MIHRYVIDTRLAAGVMVEAISSRIVINLRGPRLSWTTSNIKERTKAFASRSIKFVFILMFG